MTEGEALAHAADHLQVFTCFTLCDPLWDGQVPEDWDVVQATAEAAWAWACVAIDLHRAFRPFELWQM